MIYCIGCGWGPWRVCWLGRPHCNSPSRSQGWYHPGYNGWRPRWNECQWGWWPDRRRRGGSCWRTCGLWTDCPAITSSASAYTGSTSRWTITAHCHPRHQPPHTCHPQTSHRWRHGLPWSHRRAPAWLNLMLSLRDLGPSPPGSLLGIFLPHCHWGCTGLHSGCTDCIVSTGHLLGRVASPPHRFIPSRVDWTSFMFYRSWRSNFGGSDPCHPWNVTWGYRRSWRSWGIDPTSPSWMYLIAWSTKNATTICLSFAAFLPVSISASLASSNVASERIVLSSASVVMESSYMPPFI